MKKLSNFALLIILFVTFAKAQKTEITISLNEQFFDALLDAIYQHTSPPEFPLARNDLKRRDAKTRSKLLDSKHNAFDAVVNNFYSSNVTGLGTFYSASQRLGGRNPVCKETIQLLRENNGVRSAVRFREGKIYAPLAFSGSYNPPFIGCVSFGGLAETNIELEFDRESQRLVARAKVLNVSLNGTGGVGSTVIARVVQSSIDKKINPIEIIRMDKVSFAIPIQNSTSLKMKAVGIRHEITNGVLNVYIAYEFLKP